jgi:hypothetical protein
MKDWAAALIAAASIILFVVFGSYIILWAMP